MSGDLQMIRGAAEDGWNLSLGEPVALQKHLVFPKTVLSGPFTYPTLEGVQELRQELDLMYPGRYVVIANGAKQALSAGFHALKAEGAEWVYHRPPYWPSYTTLTRMAGLRWQDYASGRAKAINCVTSPNNPDGSELPYPCDILDAVYASTAYKWSGAVPPHRIRIGSAAKLLGLSGARVGWLVTDEHQLAEAARQYVEFTTSGVSIPSQIVVANALYWLRESRSYESVALAVGDEIRDNGLSFNHYLGEYCSEIKGVPENEAMGAGMFAFFKVHDPAAFVQVLIKSKVSLVTGEACGMKEPGWYRMNMGHTKEYTKAALQAIAGAL